MKQPLIQSLSRALGLLEAVAANPSGARLADLCRGAGLNRTTAHHLLRTLAAHGYVLQGEEDRSYRVGPKLMRLASATWSDAQIAQLALPLLRQLAQSTGETTNLAIRKDHQAILVETIDGAGTLRVVDRVGAARPIYASAIGKVLLAWSPADEREAVVEALRFKVHTKKTIVDKRSLRRELALVRDCGYALDDEEMTKGVRCIAAPVFALPGQVVAAVGIAGPAVRVSKDQLLRFSKPLAMGVRRLSARLARPS